MRAKGKGARERGTHEHCAMCSNNLPFDVPPFLLEEMKNGRVALFAGAGVSRELPRPSDPSFYNRIADVLKADGDVPFPDLMQRMIDLPNGRIKLLQEIRTHFDRIEAFTELRVIATRFHRALAPIFEIQTIVTTNWDPYFERYCDATPFVTPDDYAYWDVSARRVLKIHGSVTNLGSIVATRDDYKRCEARLTAGSLGATVKHILATQTPLFVGYSFSDSDFLSLFNAIRDEIKGLGRPAYVVTLDKGSVQRFEELGLTPILTEGSYFISKIGQHLEHASSHHLSEAALDEVDKLYARVRHSHRRLFRTFRWRLHPSMLITAFYQDGLMHGLDWIGNHRRSGRSSHTCELARVLTAYEALQKAHTRRRLWEDVAYIEGYLNAFRFVLSSKIEDAKVTHLHLPLHFLFGCDWETLGWEEYVRKIRRAHLLHPASHNRMRKYANMHSDWPDGIDIHHPVILRSFEQLGSSE